MLTAFLLQDDNSFATLHSLPAIQEACAMEGARIWIDAEDPTEADIVTLGATLHIDAEAVEDCLHGGQRARIDEYDDHSFLVVYGALKQLEGDGFTPRKLAAVFGQRFLLTVHKEPLVCITSVRARCERLPAHILGRGIDHVLYTIIDGMVDNYAVVVDHFEQRLEKLEEVSFGPDVAPGILGELSLLQREALELRRIAASVREVLEPVADGEFGFISKELETRFRHVRDHLTMILESVESLHDLLHGVRDNYNAVLSNRLNAIMKALTIFASLFLPLTFIVGIYGMNMPLWPAPSSLAAFWGVLGFMAVIAVAMLLYFRSRRWL